MADREILRSHGSRGYWVDDRIEVERRKAWIFGANINDLWIGVPRKLNTSRKRVVEVRESDTILCSYGSTKDDAIDGVELAKVLVVGIDVFVQWLKPWTTRYCDV